MSISSPSVRVRAVRAVRWRRSGISKVLMFLGRSLSRFLGMRMRRAVIPVHTSRTLFVANSSPAQMVRVWTDRAKNAGSLRASMELLNAHIEPKFGMETSE